MNRRLWAAVAAVVLLPALRAGAYPQEELTGSCRNSYQTYTFDASWASYPTAKSWAREALAVWNDALDWDATPLATVTESVAGAITVSLDSAVTGYGDAGCESGTSGRIRIDPAYVGNASVLKFTSAHEMGHMLGLHHTGDWDSDDGWTPYMAACLTDELDMVFRGTLSHDDAASLTWRHGAPGYHQLHANYGFEEGTKYWNLNGGTWEWQSTGGNGGPARIRHKTASTASYVSQRIRLATGDDDGRYRVVVHYKVGSAAYTGSVTGTLYRRFVNYSESATNTCGYTDGLTVLNHAYVNDPTGYAAVATTGAQTVTGKTSWTGLVTPWANVVDAEGYDLDLRVASHAEDAAGTDQWVYLDNLRGEGCETCA